MLRDKVMSSNMTGVFSTVNVDVQLDIFMSGLEHIHTTFEKKKRRVKFGSDNWLKCSQVRSHQSMSDLAYTLILKIKMKIIGGYIVV